MLCSFPSHLVSQNLYEKHIQKVCESVGVGYVCCCCRPKKKEKKMVVKVEVEFKSNDLDFERCKLMNPEVTIRYINLDKIDKKIFSNNINYSHNIFFSKKNHLIYSLSLQNHLPPPLPLPPNRSGGISFSLPEPVDSLMVVMHHYLEGGKGRGEGGKGGRGRGKGGRGRGVGEGVLLPEWARDGVRGSEKVKVIFIYMFFLFFLFCFVLFCFVLFCFVLFCFFLFFFLFCFVLFGLSLLSSYPLSPFLPLLLPIDSQRNYGLFFFSCKINRKISFL